MHKNSAILCQMTCTMGDLQAIRFLCELVLTTQNKLCIPGLLYSYSVAIYMWYEVKLLIIPTKYCQLDSFASIQNKGFYCSLKKILIRITTEFV